MTDPGDVVVFDLDDTLYLERDYVRSGFRAVADAIAMALPALRERSFEILWQDFERGVRGSSFDRLGSALPEIIPRLPVERMIAIYRGHRPEIGPMPGADLLLRRLKAGNTRCGLITDGQPRQQLAKLEALGLESCFDRIIVNQRADRFKPDCRSFARMQRELAGSSRRCWYVADNPVKDFIGPRQLGWKSIRIRRPGQLWEHLPSTGGGADFTVCDLSTVLEFVATGADKTTA
jgi:putative hydrolase of the HAD superfamily